jgi:hypothetical protein
MKKLKIHVFLIMLIYQPLFAQEEESSSEGGQSRESAAVDPTAAQWSYQFAYEGFYNYEDDQLEDGSTRPAGDQGFFQFRLVAPIPKTDKIPITMLPRLTFRVKQNSAGDWGIGGSDLFILGIINQWSTGRWGIGPQINFPSMEGFGNRNWGGGLAAAVTQRAMNDRLFFALLLQQSWTKVNNETQATNLIINPTFVFQIANGWYAGNGDFVIQYNWQNGGWFFPMGLRVGKAFINEKRTINTYVEWAASAGWPGWEGSVAGHSIRINFQFQIPVKF